MCVYWYTGLSLVCYLENICVRYVVDENIFPNSVCLARKWFGFLDLPSKKWYYKTHTKKTPKTAHLPYIQPTPIKIWHDKGSISGPRERVHRSFMKQYNLCNCIYHCRRLIFCLNSLRYVFKIYVRAYFNQQLSVGIYTDQIHLQ